MTSIGTIALYALHSLLPLLGKRNIYAVILKIGIYKHGNDLSLIGREVCRGSQCIRIICTRKVHTLIVGTDKTTEITQYPQHLVGRDVASLMYIAIGCVQCDQSVIAL